MDGQSADPGRASWGTIPISVSQSAQGPPTDDNRVTENGVTANTGIDSSMTYNAAVENRMASITIADSRMTDNSPNEQAAPTFWPELRDHLKRCLTTPGSRNISQPICSICSKELIIAGLTSHIPEPDDTEPAALLACGHIVGLDCILDWQASCADEENHTTCPTCRFQLDGKPACDRCVEHKYDTIVDISKAIPEMIHHLPFNEARPQCDDCKLLPLMGIMERRLWEAMVANFDVFSETIVDMFAQRPDQLPEQVDAFKRNLPKVRRMVERGLVVMRAAGIQ